MNTRILKELYESSEENFGITVLKLKGEDLLPLVTLLKDECGFDLLLDVTAVDYPDCELRFEVVYHLYSSRHNRRLRLKVPVPESCPAVPTLTGLYGSACYAERETHEMYGIEFSGNGDLRPILLYEGFDGHPLRKDYPIDGEQPIVAYRK
ncbi:MAG: NADH-quinone oxidoreductase subunit C [Desulfuromonadales bacterium]|nr:MAG: NADH-quinone oxidoreductase subunit C [Desulfuromonadales bacterium]